MKKRQLSVKEFEIQKALGLISAIEEYTIARTTDNTKLLRLMATSGIMLLKRNILRNPNIPEGLLYDLSYDSNDTISCTALQIRRERERAEMTSNEFLRQYERGIVPIKELAMLASRAQTLGKILAKLATDKNIAIRNMVARNPSTPAKTLNLMLQDKSEEVKASAKVNPNLPLSKRKSDRPGEL